MIVKISLVETLFNETLTSSCRDQEIIGFVSITSELIAHLEIVN